MTVHSQNLSKHAPSLFSCNPTWRIGCWILPARNMNKLTRKVPSRLLRPVFQPSVEHDECSFSSSTIFMPARIGLASNSDTRPAIGLSGFSRFYPTSVLRAAATRPTRHGDFDDKQGACLLVAICLGVSPVYNFCEGCF